mmetsp:Transcript_3234/g.8880  ORF Transcript_3234/g.8880 Transcript_3234/m.8880 type:complete len:211 (-) Transcript_3234:284-916(-)
MPAAAMTKVTRGQSFTLTAIAIAALHSWLHNDCDAHCHADNEDAHAVSILPQGPFRLSTKELRPAATDTLLEVAANIDERVEGGSTRAQSGDSIPKNTPTSQPDRVDRRFDDLCMVSYPHSSRMRCCGSKWDASVQDNEKKCASKSCTPLTNPACCEQASGVRARPELQVSCRDQRLVPTASPLASWRLKRYTSDMQPPGHLPFAPATCK